MAHILVTGVATADYILDVAEYPREDAKVRAVARATLPGGNATNTACVLAQAGHRVDLAATVAIGQEGEELLSLVRARGVGTETCVRVPGRTPISHILRARDTGSRTIVHFRDLPEVAAADFRKLALSGYDWFHFEGRNPLALPALLRAARAAVVDSPLSLELEKPGEGLDRALPHADVLLFSRSWVEANGVLDPEAFIQQAARERGEQVQTLTWGQRGAWIARGGEVWHCSPQAGLVVVDSVGAGDTFNAGLIDALSSGQPPEQALASAVRLAERKLTQQGLDDLFPPKHRGVATPGSALE